MLKNKSAIITGASRGLGREIAIQFVQSGANVCLMARTEADLLAVKKELEGMAKPDQKIISVVGDVSLEQDVKNICSFAIERFGNIEILVNNAGVYGPKGAIETNNLTEWQRALNINLMSNVLFSHYLVPHFKQNKYGKIISLSGGGATKPLANLSAYAASKAAVVRFCETLAVELRDYNVDVNTVAPGALNTKMLEEVLDAGPDVVGKQFYENSRKQEESGGAGLSKGAQLCVFLASQKSDGITGRLLSAIWDNWETMPARLDQFKDGDVYTLRRITDKDRGFSWDK